MRKFLLNAALIAAFLMATVSVYAPALATVTSATNTITYTGDNSTTEFSFPYLFYDEDHLVVKVDGTTQTITTHYTVAGEGVGAGGTVTFVTAPATDAAIVIQRIVPYTQGTDFSNFDGNPADVTEKQFDLVTMMASQVGEENDRAILAPVGTTLTSNDISGTIDTTSRLLTITTAGPATALVGSLSDNLDVTLSGEASGDLLRYNGTDWSNVTQASLGLLTDVVSDTTPQAGGDFDMNGAQMQWSKGADIASATALTPGTDGNYFDVTGTTTITSIATTGGPGTVIGLHFDGALTLTHHATDLILPSAANITTAAGDEAILVEYASGDYRVISYSKADGTAVVGGSGALTKIATATASNSTSIDFTSGIDSTYEEYELHVIDLVPATDNTSLYLRTDSDAGASFDSGASDYGYASNRLDSDASSSSHSTSGDSSATHILLANQVGSAAGESLSGVIRFFNPAGTAAKKIFDFNMSHLDSTNSIRVMHGAGVRLSTGDVDAVRLVMSSGNITSGEFKLYGIEK